MANFFTIKVKILKFDDKGYTEELGKVLEVQTRQAAKEWLRSVVKEVPVYSGESRGSLLPLGRFLRVSIPIDPVEAAIKRYPNGVAKGEEQQLYQFKSTESIYTFKFNTFVPQYLTNEFNRGLGQPPLIHLTPWHSLEEGKIAFQQYLRENLKEKVPRVLKYLTRVKIGE